ncbi:flagellar basal body protein FliL [Pseudoroseomonas wenyumeiae]|uniref:Flagellar protein FliL n=1 Tax=Teichococcus wenyumeiae TaxID=2478470 RepID=A0A3A9J558_9PROT|nr:flagellar basal body-associated FliL family protein [Pseudoroseomonas wenyumeiae]RKK01582.1 flagellar basal body protein FliL [Pseudoroseomonas wenyumeiae]RMI20148.1 flagellar basal body protein FliL [Pseudoroseomonas wenyumeiae]
MSATTTDGSAKKSGKKGGRLLLFGAAALLLLGGGAGAAWVFVPGASESMRKIIVGEVAPAEQALAAASPANARPVFVELPEMTLTLPNAGRPRQLRLKLAMEVAADPSQPPPELMNPRVYDSLVLYLRTLRDGELEGALAMDRLRGDLHRRLDLLLGEGRVRDVLITGFVVA